jgi:hypothetical protein
MWFAMSAVLVLGSGMGPLRAQTVIVAEYVPPVGYFGGTCAGLHVYDARTHALLRRHRALGCPIAIVADGVGLAHVVVSGPEDDDGSELELQTVDIDRGVVLDRLSLGRRAYGAYLDLRRVAPGEVLAKWIEYDASFNPGGQRLVRASRATGGWRIVAQRSVEGIATLASHGDHLFVRDVAYDGNAVTVLSIADLSTLQAFALGPSTSSGQIVAGHVDAARIYVWTERRRLLVYDRSTAALIEDREWSFPITFQLAFDAASRLVTARVTRLAPGPSAGYRTEYVAIALHDGSAEVLATVSQHGGIPLVHDDRVYDVVYWSECFFDLCTPPTVTVRRPVDGRLVDYGVSASALPTGSLQFIGPPLGGESAPSPVPASTWSALIALAAAILVAGGRLARADRRLGAAWAVRRADRDACRAACSAGQERASASRPLS